MSESLRRGCKRVAIVASAIVVASLVGTVSVDAGVPPTTGITETATLTITKTVDGDAPADASFTILVDCESSGSYELNFGATGGEDSVTFFNEDVCEISEPVNGGASSTSGLGVIEIEDPILYARTVTNTFGTDPTSATTAATAAAAATRPTFTG